MTTAYTSLLGLALPVTGELSGTWGDTVNTAITSLLDTAVAGTTSITTDADITLTTTTGASNQARQAIILWNPASGTTTRYITAPAQSKLYTVINASGGTQSVVIRGAGPTTGVTIAKGESAMVAWNGSDFVKVSSSGGAITFTDLTVTGNTILGDAAADTLTVNATSTFASPVNFQGLVKLPSTGRSAAAALTVTAPAFLYGVASTYTDTTSSGTIGAMAPFYSIAQPTLSTSNVTTYTNAATLYIANAPAAGGSATITNPYAMYVNSGASYLGGAVSLGSTLAVAGATNLNGAVTLGDAAADNITVTGTVTSNLLFTDDTYDIGASGATRPRREFLSQSLYIGATTVPWSTTTRKVLQFGSSGSANYFSASQQVTNACFGSLAWNAYGTSTDNEWKYYTSTDRANLFQIAAGGYTWYNAPVGTADATIAWTTVANLNSSGNFGLGGAPAGAYSNRRSLEILGNTVSNLSLGAAIGEITYNLYLNSGGSTLYQTDGPAALQNFNNNVSSGFAWLMAPTGTAGAGVSSLGQHMSLQRSASASILGIGSSTPTTSWEQTRAIAVGTSASFFGDGESYNWPAGIVTNGYRTASNVWKYSAPTASAIPSWKFEQGNGVNGWAWDYSVTGALSSTITYTRYMYLNNSGNLGMQVSSPSYQLDMGGGTSVSSRVQLRRGSDDSSQNLLLGWSSISSTRSSVSLSNAQSTLSFDQIGSDGTRTNLYINSNGTIGIGATNTYSWDITRFKAIYFGSASSGNYFSVSQQFTAACAGGLSWNAYGSGNNTFKYMTTGDPASRLSMAGNQIRLYGAPTGTADADITFTEMLGLQKDYTVSLQGATQATGTGITFPATQNASSNANTLDDYEEGTWTPGISFASGGPATTTGNTSGRYVKVGKQVTCWFYINVSSLNSGSGQAYITGLPFTNSSVIGAAEGATMSPNYWSGFASAVIPGGYVQYNQAQVLMVNLDAGTAVSVITAASMTSTPNLYANFTYFTD